MAAAIFYFPSSTLCELFACLHEVSTILPTGMKSEEININSVNALSSDLVPVSSGFHFIATNIFSDHHYCNIISTLQINFVYRLCSVPSAVMGSPSHCLLPTFPLLLCSLQFTACSLRFHTPSVCERRSEAMVFHLLYVNSAPLGCERVKITL